MFKRFKSVGLMGVALAVVLASCLPLITNAQGSRYSLTIRNNSGYAIKSIYLSLSDSRVWGDDQLGRYTIESGHTFTLTDIRPGEYDIRFVDEDGDVCVLNHQNVFHNLSWQLSQSWLLNCERYR